MTFGIAGGCILFLALNYNNMLFTAVPSSNPNAKLNMDLLHKLRDVLHVNVLDAQTGRFRFSPMDARTLPYHQWPTVLSTARSIRWIVMELENDLTSTDNETVIADKVYARLCRGKDTTSTGSGLSKEDILNMFQAFLNFLPRDRVPSFDLSCRRWNDSVIPKQEGFSTVKLSHQLRGVVAHTYGWTPHRRCCQSHNGASAPADLEFQVVLSGNSCFMELVLLVPTRLSLTQELPRPGCKRVEAWMLVKTCDIQEGHIVLDPLCGKATFLVEAATITTLSQQQQQQSTVRYIGVDQSKEQLEDAQCNINETGTRHIIELRQGDARLLDFLDNDSVDVIVTCPPFGKQFAVGTDLDTFYRNCVTEWVRVCRGRMVTLIDTENADRMVRAMEQQQNNDTGRALQLIVRREPFRLGRLMATVLVAIRTNAAKRINTNHDEPSHVLPWEGPVPLTRAAWTRQRAASLPSLVPYTSATLPSRQVLMETGKG